MHTLPQLFFVQNEDLVIVECLNMWHAYVIRYDTNKMDCASGVTALLSASHILHSSHVTHTALKLQEIER